MRSTIVKVWDATWFKIYVGCLIAFVVLVASQMALSAIYTAEEDTLMFNCHLSGNGVCGPHSTDNGNFGFVNLFPNGE